MSDNHSYDVNLRLVAKYRVMAEFPEVSGTPSLLFDEGPPVGDGQGPNAAMVLGAAIGDCLSATLMNCLIRTHVDVEALTATVVTRVARNQAGRYRISGIEVELCPTVPPGRRAGLERCQAIFQDYCTVTESVREGIPVTVSFAQR
jgi:organic hydroperoxide reductase OsmC/OhrA